MSDLNTLKRTHPLLSNNVIDPSLGTPSQSDGHPAGLARDGARVNQPGENVYRYKQINGAQVLP